MNMDKYETLEDFMNSPRFLGIRKSMGFNDKNDGFNRSLFSRSKSNFSRNRKVNRITKVRPIWKQHPVEEVKIEEDFV